jgi:hypothetical protein
MFSSSLYFYLSLSLLFSLYLTIYILGMTTGHVPTEEITRNRKRPKKTSINSTIAREVFDGQHRKKLEIPIIIDYYNYYMNSVDIAN